MGMCGISARVGVTISPATENVCACFLALLNGPATEKVLIKAYSPTLSGGGKWEMGASHCWLVHKRPVQVRLRVQIEQILHVLTEQNNNTFITHLHITLTEGLK